jgi:flagellar biogenesis protein FliO
VVEAELPRVAVTELAPELSLQVPAPAAPARNLSNSAGLLTRALKWIRERQSARFNNRRLNVAASVSLGDKRFVAVIQVDGLQFLVGGGATNVALLAQLNGKESFGDLLQEKMTVHINKIDEPMIEHAREQA